jgi:peptidylprolyl isomerase
VRRPAAALIALTTILALTACSPDGAEPKPDAPVLGPSAGGPSPDDVAALDAVVVQGDVGSEPTVTFDLPFAVTAPVARVDVPGEGEPLEPGQRVMVDYMMVDGDDGTTVASTWATDTPESITLGDPQIISALTDLLAEQDLGVRIVMAMPGGAATETTEAYAAVVMAMEVVAFAASRAEGAAVPPADGLPIVTLADDGSPSIEIPVGTQEPGELVNQTLIRGAGSVVEPGQAIVVQYTGWLWDGTVFDSSWESGVPLTTQIGVGSVITGWDEGLVGQTVGSQVLLVIPPDLAYGADGSGLIPPDATLVFVVDILQAS